MPEVHQSPAANPEPGQPAGGVIATPPPSFTVRNVFVGAEGIRAGWGILVFFALFLALMSATGSLVHALQNLHSHYPRIAAPTQSQPQPATRSRAPMSPGMVFQHEGIPFLSVLLATWLMGKIEGRPASAYGFSPSRRMHNFWAGVAWGFALLSLLVVILRAAGMLVFDQRLLFGRDVFRYGSIWLGNFLLVGLLEEIMSRGYLQFTLTRGLSAIYRWRFGATHANGLGFWTAAFILSFAFGFDHRANPGESPLGLLSAGLAGFLFCLSLWRTGSLWWAIGFHAAWDWAQSFLYGVADSGLMVQGHLFATHPAGRPYLSGGLTGPEGSLFLLPVMLAGVVVILFTLPRNRLGYAQTNAVSAVTALDLP